MHHQGTGQAATGCTSLSMIQAMWTQSPPNTRNQSWCALLLCCQGPSRTRMSIAVLPTPLPRECRHCLRCTDLLHYGLQTLHLAASEPGSWRAVA